MEMIFCPNCGKLTGYKRALGFGTFFAALLTAGLWLLAIPFYPKRCITCGLGKSESVPWYQTWRLAAVILAGGVLAAVLLLPSAPKAPRTAEDSTVPAPTEGSVKPTEKSEAPAGKYPLLGATPDVVAAGQVQKGDLSTAAAQKLSFIEDALKQDEDNWIGHGRPGEPHCLQTSASECRRVFLNAITYKPVILGPGGREGLIVEVSRFDFGCGNHVCPGFVLRKIDGGYERVLRGNSYLLDVTSIATNGYYNIVEGETTYVWDGARYSAR
jgi:hypothetical protein